MMIIEKKVWPESDPNQALCFFQLYKLGLRPRLAHHPKPPSCRSPPPNSSPTASFYLADLPLQLLLHCPPRRSAPAMSSPHTPPRPTARTLTRPPSPSPPRPLTLPPSTTCSACPLPPAPPRSRLPTGVSPSSAIRMWSPRAAAVRRPTSSCEFTRLTPPSPTPKKGQTTIADLPTRQRC